MRGTLNRVPVRHAAWAALVLSAAVCAVRAAEEEKKTGTIVVHVVDDAGQPAAGAAIDLFGYDSDKRCWKNDHRPSITNDEGRATYTVEVGSYVIRATTNGKIAYRDANVLEEGEEHRAELILAAPVAASLMVTTAAGQPLEGAWIERLEFSGDNGSININAGSFAALEWPRSVSQADGRLMLPPLPAGNRAEIKIGHADYAPFSLKDVLVEEKQIATAALGPGVTLTLQVAGAGAPPLDELALDIRHEPFVHPSTNAQGRLKFAADGTSQFTVAAGDYHLLALKHVDYLIVPWYSNQWSDSAAKPFVIRPGYDSFEFRALPKVRVRGRVVDATTGAAMPKTDVHGEVFNTISTGPFAKFADEWTHADWGETDAEGRYEMRLAPGRGRITFQGEKYVSDVEHVDIDIAADGSTVAPDILVRPLPKIRGTVLAGGRPVARAVVRFGDFMLRGMESVATDAEGRFELEPSWMPVDFNTNVRQPMQHVTAFHPYEPLAGEATVQLDEPESLVDVRIELRPRDVAEPFARNENLTEWERGIVTAERTSELAAISLRGKPAPALDGVAWLNVEKPTMSLADFRGKYVLLDFWTTWCGPCHGDFPNVKLLYELYKDRGFVIIGVHDNSMTLEAIKADVAKCGLTFPIVVDHPDGRILAEYNKHGISGYPSYLLIGPDGTAIRDDDTIAGPSLRIYKIEIIRQLLLGGTAGQTTSAAR